MASGNGENRSERKQRNQRNKLAASMAAAESENGENGGSIGSASGEWRAYNSIGAARRMADAQLSGGWLAKTKAAKLNHRRNANGCL